PHALVIDARDGKLSYEQLDGLSTKFAKVPIDRGVKSSQRVPLLFEKSMLMSVAMPGLIKAGVVGVGIDLRQPEKRLRQVVQQVGATLIVSIKLGGGFVLTKSEIQ
ncbi:hypothetical protein BKA60DRAFT_474383, partial [Fusarium oxysporum]